jgi:hypothetical protein
MKDSPKTRELSRLLSITRHEAIGILVCLWTWGIYNADRFGNILCATAEDIADGVMSRGQSADVLLDSLVKSGWIDVDEVDGHYVLHDWDEWQEPWYKAIDKRNADTLRKREQRKTGDNAQSSGQSAGQSGGTALHNRNLTVPNLTYLLSGGDNARAHASDEREIVNEFLENRDLTPERYFGYTAETGAQAERLTREIYARFALKPPTWQDVVYVFNCTRRSIEPEDPGNRDGWRIDFPKDKADLLMYAFELATRKGDPGNWNYIIGVLKVLHQRGIKTLEEAKEYDADREMRKAGIVT